MADNDMVSGKRRNVKLLGRELKNYRRVHLLSSKADVRFDPSRWFQTQGAKDFDEKSTAILRVYKHKTEDKYLVHGMRSQRADGAKTATVVAEAHEFAAMVDALPAVIAQVAAHCGIEALVGGLK